MVNEKPPRILDFLGDALIAATALAYNELLCTSNMKQFVPMNGLLLELYSGDS